LIILLVNFWHRLKEEIGTLWGFIFNKKESVKLMGPFSGPQSIQRVHISNCSLLSEGWYIIKVLEDGSAEVIMKE
jgi:hypothetical protein